MKIRYTKEDVVLYLCLLSLYFACGAGAALVCRLLGVN